MRNALVWTVIILGLFVLFQTLNGSSENAGEIAYTKFIEEVKAGNVQKVEIEGQDVKGTYSSGGNFTAVKPIFHENLYELLSNNNVDYTEKKVDQSFLTTALISWLPFILLIGVWIFFMRQMQGKGGGGGAMGFGKSRARLLTEKQGRVTFDDVAGIEEAKEELEEIVDFLKDPQKFQKVGGQIPKGALLVGPPGTGKTLLARAIAGEANVPFFTISGSDFVEMFVGVGASRVRDMFEQAKKNAPCIIFIDVNLKAVSRAVLCVSDECFLFSVRLVVFSYL